MNQIPTVFSRRITIVHVATKTHALSPMSRHLISYRVVDNVLMSKTAGELMDESTTVLVQTTHSISEC